MEIMQRTIKENEIRNCIKSNVRTVLLHAAGTTKRKRKRKADLKGFRANAESKQLKNK